MFLDHNSYLAVSTMSALFTYLFFPLYSERFYFLWEGMHWDSRVFLPPLSEANARFILCICTCFFLPCFDVPYSTTLPVYSHELSIRRGTPSFSAGLFINISKHRERLRFMPAANICRCREELYVWIFKVVYLISKLLNKTDFTFILWLICFHKT